INKFKSNIDLDSIIVTANKFPQKQSTTGKVVTVINKEQLKLNYGKTISEILTDQVGLQIGGAFGSAGTIQSVYTRGAASGRTLILIDGVPIYNPAQNNEFDLNLLNLQNIERIEILKGAQSTLYGSEAVAGVINIITNKPNIDKLFFFQTNLSTGSFNTQKSGVEWGGQFGNFSFVVQNDAVNSDGFSFARDTSGKGNFGNNGYDGNSHNLTMQYKLTPQLTIKNYYRKSYYKTNIDADAFKDEKDNTSSNKNFVSGIGVDFKNDKVTFNFNYQYSENTVNFKNDSIQISSPYFYFSTNDYFSKFQFAEFYTTIQLSKNIKLLHGADYRFNSMNNQYFSFGSFGPYSSNLNDTSISQSSIYTSIFWTDNTQQWNIDFGGRLNVHSNYGSNYTYTFNPSYNINKAFRVFGSISTAFKTPSLYQLFSSYGDVNLKPEQSISKEVGFSQTNKNINNRIVYFN
ncbi:MAG: TonB-dependent receptor, partial [Sediminibacterium sp.]|nr:TonB-dependent receptor [Sediminibacterium sp.]